MLKHLETIENEQSGEEEKLKALIELVIPEEDREIYYKRYKTNSELIEMEPMLKLNISENIAERPINMKKIIKKTFMGDDAVNGQDYKITEQILQNHLNIDRNRLEEK